MSGSGSGSNRFGGRFGGRGSGRGGGFGSRFGGRRSGFGGRGSGRSGGNDFGGRLFGPRSGGVPRRPGFGRLSSWASNWAAHFTSSAEKPALLGKLDKKLTPIGVRVENRAKELSQILERKDVDRVASLDFSTLIEYENSLSVLEKTLSRVPGESARHAFVSGLLSKVKAHLTVGSIIDEIRAFQDHRIDSASKLEIQTFIRSHSRLIGSASAGQLLKWLDIAEQKRIPD
jgi:hypothetical protein